jgi:hypothetical protein
MIIGGAIVAARNDAGLRGFELPELRVLRVPVGAAGQTN